MLGRGSAPMRKLLIIFCLISIASYADVQKTETDTGSTQSNTEPDYDLPAAIAACEEMLHGPSRCESAQRAYLELGRNIYSQNHPDVIRARRKIELHCSSGSIQQKIQSICSRRSVYCDVSRRDYLQESPQVRLESAVKAGDLNFLGVPREDPESLFVPCLPDGFPEPANVISMSAVFESYVQDEIEEEYAAEYNLLLLKHLSENPD